jgi:hypothetical protein
MQTAKESSLIKYLLYLSGFELGKYEFDVRRDFKYLAELLAFTFEKYRYEKYNVSGQRASHIVSIEKVIYDLYKTIY